MNLRNQFVRFRIADIYLPDPLVVLNLLHGDDTLEGRVLDVSETGTSRQQFAVIEVPELERAIVVPLERLTNLT